MVEHRNLTGTSLHEPKGVEVAAVNTTYHADGLGSGAWIDPLARVENLNEIILTNELADVSAPGSSFFVYIPRACDLTQVSTVLQGAITGTDSIISLYRSGVLLGQTLTIPVAGSGAGVTANLLLAPVYSFTAGQTLEVRTDGASTDTQKLFVTLRFTAT